VDRLESRDPTWEAEYRHFKALCCTGETTLAQDQWINTILATMANAAAGAATE
jgi:hypothetical protein